MFLQPLTLWTLWVHLRLQQLQSSQVAKPANMRESVLWVWCTFSDCHVRQQLTKVIEPLIPAEHGGGGCSVLVIVGTRYQRSTSVQTYQSVTGLLLADDIIVPGPADWATLQSVSAHKNSRFDSWESGVIPWWWYHERCVGWLNYEMRGSATPAPTHGRDWL